MTGTDPLLVIDKVVRDYRLPKRTLLGPAPLLRAVAGVDLSVREGESFGIVGESGCGKSTLARAIMGLEPPDQGRIRFLGEDLYTATGARLKTLRPLFQMVFQDPYGSLNPRHQVGRIVAEPLTALPQRLVPAERRKRVEQALAEVGLKASDTGKYPHEFSGGQRQRIAIARAMITRPRLLVADEPVSALDVSVQAQVLNLLMDLQDSYGLTIIFISHDLSVVRHVTDRVAVMYLGRIVEQGPTAQVMQAPAHPYTRALIAAIPQPDPDTPTTGGQMGDEAGGAFDPAAETMGCAFAPRCPLAEQRCLDTRPGLTPVDDDHLAACHMCGH